MEITSVESIKKLTIDNILKDKNINELYQDIMEQIIDAASSGQIEITTDIIKFNDNFIKLEELFKLLGYHVFRCVSPSISAEVKLNVSWL